MIKEETKKNICTFKDCNKKIKITDFPCKCEKYFCKFHKQPEIHKCEYDYKENDKKQKLIESMMCNSSKIQKIT